MKVFHKGDSWTFIVTSADDKDAYTVDLKNNGWKGSCTCGDFNFRCQPRLNDGSKIISYAYTDRTMCKHLQEVYIYLAVYSMSKQAGKTMEEFYEMKGQDE